MNILLVSDDNEFAQNLKEKLVFLRKDDRVAITDYEHAKDDVKKIDVVLIHEAPQALELIKQLRVSPELCLILVAKSCDSEIILSASDLGVDDFVLENANDFEFVLRIINNTKHNSFKHLALKYFKMLEQTNFADEFLGLFRYEYCKYLLNDYKRGTFVALTPCDKSSFSAENAVSIIKSALRVGDIPFLGSGANFYIFLPETDFNGAVVVFNKINEKIKIRAGFSDISSCEYEKEALNLLAEATDGEYAFAEIKENTLDEWLSDVPHGGYKLFRKIFNTKMEKVIAPVFYRLQKSYETKLFETEIEQYTNSEQCVFRLKNKSGESSLRIVYPGFAKIMIYINHEGLDSPENKEISLPLDKITQKELINIVESFIEEFKEIKCYQ